MNEPAPGFALAADDGERLSFAGGNFVIRASAETTGGAFSIVEEAPPMLDTPLHDHANEDELFYILEGEHVVQCGEDEFRLGPGGTAFLPRGVPHSQRRVETGVGRLLALTYPAGFSSASSTRPSAPARSARTCTRASPRSTASPGSAERSQRAADQVRARAHDPDHKAPPAQDRPATTVRQQR